MGQPITVGSEVEGSGFEAWGLRAVKVLGFWVYGLGVLGV